MIIQIVVTIGIVIFVLPSIYSSFKKKTITPFAFFIWILFWLIGLVLIWDPSIIDFIGKILGVGRSIDALVYIAIVFLLYSTLNQRIKINELSKEITLLNRKIAIKDVKEDKK